VTKGETAVLDSTYLANAVRDTVYQATIYLDDEKWDDWLGLCSEEFEYTIKCFSPEINQDMTYLHGKKSDLAALIKLLPKHNTDHSALHRHTSVYLVDVADNGRTATAVSSFLVFQTLLDGNNSHIDAGESHLFLVGKYYDKFSLEGNRPTFLSRETRIYERRLDKGSHWPI
jgi:methanesulfonate monooxygenase subunit beta